MLAFSIAYQDKHIHDTDNRSRKVWLLLAYMIYFRNRSIPIEALIHLLWPNEHSSSNPSNVLKTMFHRLRSTLDQLGADVGHTLIIRAQGEYAFNTELSLDLDILRFEAFCTKGKLEQDPQVRRASYLDALTLYQGDFLPKLSTEAFVIPIAAYYHSLYLQTTHETLALLEETQQTDLSAASAAVLLKLNRMMNSFMPLSCAIYYVLASIKSRFCFMIISAKSSLPHLLSLPVKNFACSIETRCALPAIVRWIWIPSKVA